MSTPKLWKVVYDRSGVVGHTRLISPEGHEIPGVWGMRQVNNSGRLEVEIDISAGLIVECFNADGTVDTRELTP